MLGFLRVWDWWALRATIPRPSRCKRTVLAIHAYSPKWNEPRNLTNEGGTCVHLRTICVPEDRALTLHSLNLPPPRLPAFGLDYSRRANR